MFTFPVNRPAWCILCPRLLLQTIDDVIERLVREYDPDRIILFGSRALGTSTEDSDIDLLVVKETASRPLDRRVHVERLLRDRSAAS